MALRLNGSTSGYVELDAPAVAGTTALTLPATSGALMTVPGAWTSYTPTLGSITIGNGSLSFAYTQMGKTVILRGLITLGSTSSVGTNPTFTLPVNNNTTGMSQNATPLGHTTYIDSGTNEVHGRAVWNGASVLLLQAINVAGTYPVPATISSTVPFTWTTDDSISIIAMYEAA